MNVTYHNVYSSSLNRNMEYKVYGHQGKPVLVFPTSCGRFYQYEDCGMIGELAPYIEQGRLQVWTCDSIDEETFYADGRSADERMKRHDQYDAYISRELIPSILEQSKANNDGHAQKLLATGCSLGAYHSANVFFRHPQYFDSLIALSGLYSMNRFFGEHIPASSYFHSPLHYLSNLEDEAYLTPYRNSRIFVCTGQGAYEDLMRTETQKLKEVLHSKHVPATVDFWGHDVSHDWHWWRKQIRHYMDQLMG
ncbi:esterase family protein [Paenibacillus sp. YYML68]|uniref:esterase family protein n=1 Tax=Paenibacillus sp. YYML68 TaxID=2909250 RepID=UPI00248FB0D1|nr:alpha/beta hydrolase-fold protein [Paenibacillus sp. YYML68]